MTKAPFKPIDVRISSGSDVKLPLHLGGSIELRLRILETLIHTCPAHFFIAFAANDAADPTWMTAWRAAAGRAMTAEDGRFAAICEAVERASLFTEGESDRRLGDQPPAESDALNIESLWQYSAKQLQQFRANMRFIARYNCGQGVDELWVTGHHLTRGTAHRLPASSVLLGEDERLGLPPIISSSSGAAVRETFAGATQHAVLELVERDAVAIWWYNRLVAPRLDPAEADHALPPPLALWLRERKRQTWHLRIATDLPVPAIVALSAEPDGSGVAIGASAALDPAAAVRSATLELLQGEIALTQMAIAQTWDAPPPIPHLLGWSGETDAHASPHLAGDGTAPLGTPIAFDTLTAAFDERGIDVYVANLTRADLGVPAAKVISPHLRDWLPRFGPGRLYDVPVALGLLDTPTAEEALNPVPFVI
ncbi:YcaO-like family protein [Acuticoccus sp. M5D2P5]|uniref:YcaO-like family protein n=1 Tax=Acuticoccus kalidii TaxID=2910977 RepID=UPI001F26F507|nr:YcaO-like family protein [Acuticoccus kalidii]MCF3935423.1 YcaO-like family protein [Acuticoccus kalidii]